MNIKKMIKFTDLRNEGFSALDIEGDEVILIQSKGSQKCIVNQEYLLALMAAKTERIPSQSLFGASKSLLNSARSNSYQELEDFKSELTGEFESFKAEIKAAMNKKEEK